MLFMKYLKMYLKKEYDSQLLLGENSEPYGRFIPTTLF